VVNRFKDLYGPGLQELVWTVEGLLEQSRDCLNGRGIRQGIAWTVDGLLARFARQGIAWTVDGLLARSGIALHTSRARCTRVNRSASVAGITLNCRNVFWFRDVKSALPSSGWSNEHDVVRDCTVGLYFTYVVWFQFIADVFYGIDLIHEVMVSGRALR